jgi:hypothetical protein
LLVVVVASANPGRGVAGLRIVGLPRRQAVVQRDFDVDGVGHRIGVNQGLRRPRVY